MNNEEVKPKQNTVLSINQKPVETPQSNGPVVSAAVVPQDHISILMELVKTLAAQQQISAQREARVIKIEEETEARKVARRQRDAASAAAEDGLILKRQAACAHLKGGKHRSKKSAKDFSLIHHMFIDQMQYIKCVLCKMKWYPWDTPEALFRGGQVKKNHTGLGWREAAAMMAESTNTFSRSEIVLDPSAIKPPAKEDVPDTGNVLGRQ